MMPFFHGPMARQFEKHEWSVDDVEEAMEKATYGDLAECADHCEVEPDGTCSHGYPSVLVAFGMV
jgi:hypothetical protein